jgi:hypothetical protein
MVAKFNVKTAQKRKNVFYTYVLEFYFASIFGPGKIVVP